MLTYDSTILNVRSFSNGTTFINNLKERSQDIIFLDYHLHDMKGYKILEHINKFAG